MENKLLNENPLHIFIIIAETLNDWNNSSADEGNEILLKHYEWIAALKANGKLVLSGPTDIDLISTRQVNPIGHTTGLILLSVSSREEAERWAFQDPFHVHGFRRNAVYSLKITMTNDLVYNALEKQFNPSI